MTKEKILNNNACNEHVYQNEWCISKNSALKAMESYAQYKVNELNKSDVIKSVCPTCEGRGTWEEYEIGVLTCNVCKGTGQTVL